MNQNYFISKKALVKSKPLVGLNAKEYENLEDSATLSVLKMNKSFDAVFKKMIEYSYEKMELIRYKSSCFLVTKENMPYLIDCVEKACNILDIKKVPEIYIQQDESLNAYTTGVQNPVVILNSGLLHALTHEELMYIIGHELGHIKSEHVQYKMLANFYDTIIKSFTNTSIIGVLATAGLDSAIYKWFRSAELTADRAGLLVCQHLPSVITATAKLCGCPIDIYDKLDANMFLKQVSAFDELENVSYNKFVEFAVTLFDTHPLWVLRAKELMLWVQSGEYAKIMLRNSTWSEKELERLTQATQKALEKKNKLQEQITTAVVNSAEIDSDLETVQQRTKSKTGLKRITAVNTELTKVNKTKNNKVSISKVEKQLVKADEVYQNALAEETALRKILKTPDQKKIDALTKETLGDLVNIKEITQH